jgi:hypothetical protein
MGQSLDDSTAAADRHASGLVEPGCHRHDDLIVWEEVDTRGSIAGRRAAAQGDSVAIGRRVTRRLFALEYARCRSSRRDAA